jgi:CHASE3 domain sensor protein
MKYYEDVLFPVKQYKRQNKEMRELLRELRKHITNKELLAKIDKVLK